jgi:pyridoxamine 5'-phosphate oxidase
MADSLERLSPLSLESLRENYTKGGLLEEDCDPDPIAQFRKWFGEAKAAGLKEPNAMTLATADLDGKPSARIVLLKEISPEGFTFYTNYSSRKGQELELNPAAALVFYWAELERQVRIEGQAERVSREKSVTYAHSRPRGSQLGALVSHQSGIVNGGRDYLERKLKDVETRYADTETEHLPVLSDWGGYCLSPTSLEFWQGRPNRLHDRILYQKSGEGHWALVRLSP